MVLSIFGMMHHAEEALEVSSSLGYASSMKLYMLVIFSLALLVRWFVKWVNRK